MSFEEKAKLMAIRIYSSGLFGVYGKGNFDLSLEEFEELLLISMTGNKEVNCEILREIEQFYEDIK